MAPKRTAAKKAASKSTKKVAGEPSSKAADPTPSTRADQSNFNTQLNKANATPHQKAVLEIYQQLPRFSDKKHEILAKWKADKSCSWANSYTESMTKTEETTTTKVKGYGTV